MSIFSRFRWSKDRDKVWFLGSSCTVFEALDKCEERILEIEDYLNIMKGYVKKPKGSRNGEEGR